MIQPYVPIVRRSVDYRVVVDPAAPLRGECASPCRNNGPEPVITLRRWDEQVLLHEVMHALIAEGGFAPDLDDGPLEEALVRHLSHGVYAAGWRLEPLGDDSRIRDGWADRAQPESWRKVPETDTEAP